MSEVLKQQSTPSYEQRLENLEQDGERLNVELSQLGESQAESVIGRAQEIVLELSEGNELDAEMYDESEALAREIAANEIEAVALDAQYGTDQTADYVSGFNSDYSIKRDWSDSKSDHIAKLADKAQADVSTLHASNDKNANKHAVQNRKDEIQKHNDDLASQNAEHESALADRQATKDAYIKKKRFELGSIKMDKADVRAEVEASAEANAQDIHGEKPIHPAALQINNVKESSAQAKATKAREASDRMSDMNNFYKSFAPREVVAPEDGQSNSDAEDSIVTPNKVHIEQVDFINAEQSEDSVNPENAKIALESLKTAGVSPEDITSFNSEGGFTLNENGQQVLNEYLAENQNTETSAPVKSPEQQEKESLKLLRSMGFYKHDQELPLIDHEDTDATFKIEQAWVNASGEQKFDFSETYTDQNGKQQTDYYIANRKELLNRLRFTDAHLIAQNKKTRGKSNEQKHQDARNAAGAAKREQLREELSLEQAAQPVKPTLKERALGLAVKMQFGFNAAAEKYGKLSRRNKIAAAAGIAVVALVGGSLVKNGVLDHNSVAEALPSKDGSGNLFSSDILSDIADKATDAANAATDTGSAETAKDAMDPRSGEGFTQVISHMQQANGLSPEQLNEVYERAMAQDYISKMNTYELTNGDLGIADPSKDVKINRDGISKIITEVKSR